MVAQPWTVFWGCFVNKPQLDVRAEDKRESSLGDKEKVVLCAGSGGSGSHGLDLTRLLEPAPWDRSFATGAEPQS